MSEETSQPATGRPDDSNTWAIDPATVPAEADAPMPSGTGEVVGRYVVLEEVGRGGMGRVLRAYDPKLQREVALKEVRPGALGRTGTQRLIGEARAMAMLSHPHVVSVYDVETTGDDGVVLVMEYVAGLTLAAWLRGGRAWQDVVAYFRAAGRGLAAAHAAGLLHRDFKPSNVLTTAAGVVKVTDFGLAKPKRGGSASVSLSMDGPEAALLDSVGHTTLTLGSEGLTDAGIVLGTPRYMPPEQHRGEALTEAADQYAFCVALWEALVGRPPFSGKDMLAAKLEGPPSWPVGSTPRRIADAIVRGLCPRPADRWPGMASLLAALADEPSDRRRRRVTALAGASLLGVGALAWWLGPNASPDRCTLDGAHAQLADAWDDARRERVRAAVLGVDAVYAEASWDRASTALDGYAEAWVQMHADACAASTIRGEQSPAVMDARIACLLRAKTELEATTRMLADADAEVVVRAHELTADLPELSRCADVDALLAEVESPLPQEADTVAKIRAQVAMTTAAQTAGRYDQARADSDAAVRLAADVTYGPAVVEVQLARARVLDVAGEYEAAEHAVRQALRIASRWRQWDRMQDAATWLVYLVGERQHRFDESMRYLTLARALSDGDPLRDAGVHNNFANVLRAQGKYTQAEQEHRTALALKTSALDPDHLDVASSRSNLALVLEAQGKFGEAQGEYAAVLETLLRALGEDHPEIATARNNLAASLYRQGKYDDAEREYRKAIELATDVLRPDHPDVATARNNLAAALYAAGKYAESEAEHRKVLEIRIAVLGADHPSVATSYNNLATALQEQDKFEEAKQAHLRARAIWLRVFEPDHPTIATSHNNLGLVLDKMGDDEAAEAEYRAALALRIGALEPGHPDLAQTRYNLATLLYENGRLDEARELAEDAHRRNARDDVPAEARAESAFLLAKIVWSDDPADRVRAHALATAALELYVEGDGPRPPAASKMEAWLRRHRLP